jgi:hypothetical protein
MNSDRPRKKVVAAYLGLSIVLHLSAIVLVLFATTHRSHQATVTYIDLKSIAESTSPSSPVIQSSILREGRFKAEDAEPSADNAATDSPTKPPQTTAVEIQSSPLGRGMSQGYVSSFAEGINLQKDLREYYLMLLEKINDRWWQKSETVAESALNDAVLVFVIGRDGEIVTLNMTKGSGSREVDRAIVETLKSLAPFPSLPASYAIDSFIVPLKIVAPSRLFRR